MKRPAVLIITALVINLFAGAGVCFAQGIFKIPFEFQVGGKKFPAGEYRFDRKGKEQVTLRREPKGAEGAVTVLKTLPQPTPPVTEPQLVFHAVGNFEPSYTEYMTDYLLAEVWFPGEDGCLIHVTKGAHSRQIVKGQKAGK
jgi:hypothetical protein